MPSYIGPGYEVDENGNPVIENARGVSKGMMKTVVTVDSFGSKQTYRFIKWFDGSKEWVDDPSETAIETAGFSP